MGTLLASIYLRFEIYLLIFIRILGFIIVSPLFSRRSIPVYIKIGFSLLLAYIVFTFYHDTEPLIILNFFSLAFYIAKEMITGFIMGYITTLAFSAILVAGQIIDTQVGFGIANVFDPQMNIQIPLLGNFKNVLAMMLFFAVNGHHTLFMLLADSFTIVPAGRGWFSGDLSLMIIDIFIRMFVLAFKIALPMIAAAFLGEMALGLLVRTVPQMNVFVIGIPLKIIIGLLALYLLVPVYVGFLKGMFDGMFRDISFILDGMVPR